MCESLITLLHHIPYGRVTSYGHVAHALCMLYGIHTSGRLLGRILSGLPRSQWDSVPRRRVIAQTGMIVSHKLGERGYIQEKKLIAEGVIINNHCVSKSFFWSRHSHPIHNQQ